MTMILKKQISQYYAKNKKMVRSIATWYDIEFHLHNNGSILRILFPESWRTKEKVEQKQEYEYNKRLKVYIKIKVKEKYFDAYITDIF